MLLRRRRDLRRQACGLGVVAAHQALQFGEFVYHLRREVRLCHPRGLLSQIGVGAHGGRNLARERRDALDPLRLAAELGVEGDVAELLQPRVHPRLRDPQVVLPEELRVRKPGGEDLLVPREDRRALIGGLDVGDGDEALDAPGLGVLHREELLMLLHRGLKHLGRQRQEVLRDPAHQHDGPFDQPRHLGQKPAILDQFQPAGEGLLPGLVPDRLGAFVGAQDHLGALQLRLVIVEAGDGEGVGRHEAVAARGVARADAVDLERHDLRALFARQQADDGMQRAHPAELARAPAHGFGPGEAADGFLQHIGHDLRGRAARRLDHREIDLPLLVVADLQRVHVHPGAAGEAFDGLRGRADLGAATLLPGGAALGRQPFDREREAARRGKRSGGGIGQPGLDQPVGDELFQVLGGLALHPGGDFLGEEFDEKIGHQFRLSGAGGQSAGAGSPS